MSEQSATTTERRKGSGIAAEDDSGRSRPRRKRDEEVLDAAAKVFAERGYSEASVQDVADELGILKGSLYHYIRTKEDLLFWLLEAVHRDVEEILEEVAAVEGLDPLERIALYVRRQVLYNLDNLQRISIYYHDMDRLSEDRLAKIVSQRHAHERFVNGLIREAQAAGLAEQSLDARVLTNCLFGTVIWTYRWYRPNGRVSRDRIADLCAGFALNGVVGEAPAAGR
jgi:TetR/AcrR family transcriptional regulator, cholesterol catabolism regulator